jgi:hypothetical protein
MERIGPYRVELDESYRPLPAVYLALLFIWFLSACSWTFNTYKNRHFSVWIQYFCYFLFNFCFKFLQCLTLLLFRVCLAVFGSVLVAVKFDNWKPFYLWEISEFGCWPREEFNFKNKGKVLVFGFLGFVDD